jgi:FKBP-type peptidyl-prolyl cis-trans isomerase
MKKFIGAIVGVLIIILIVVFSRGHKTDTTSMQSDSTQQVDTLQVTTTTEGTGDAAVKGDTVTVNYTGTLMDGTAFDSNVDPKFGHVQPFQFTLGSNMVIQGWEQGVLGMKVGEKRHLVIPASLAYGDRGAGALIPPGATLAFDVEVVAIDRE